MGSLDIRLGQALSEEPGFRFNGLGGMGPYLGLARLLVRDPCYFLHRSQVLPESLSGPASAWSLLLGLARLLVRDRYYFTRGSQRKRFCAGLGLSLGLARPCSEAFPPRFNLVSSRGAFLDFHSGAQHPGFGESGN